MFPHELKIGMLIRYVNEPTIVLNIKRCGDTFTIELYNSIYKRVSLRLNRVTKYYNLTKCM